MQGRAAQEGIDAGAEGRGDLHGGRAAAPRAAARQRRRRAAAAAIERLRRSATARPKGAVRLRPAAARRGRRSPRRRRLGRNRSGDRPGVLDARRGCASASLRGRRADPGHGVAPAPLDAVEGRSAASSRIGESARSSLVRAAPRGRSGGCGGRRLRPGGGGFAGRGAAPGGRVAQTPRRAGGRRSERVILRRGSAGPAAGAAAGRRRRRAGLAARPATTAARVSSARPRARRGRALALDAGLIVDARRALPRRSSPRRPSIRSS